MDLNVEALDEIELWIDNYLRDMEKKYGDVKSARDKIDHIKRVVVLANQICPNDRMAIVAAKAHDIGRFSQLELLGNFNDGKVLHHNLGEDVITRAVFKGELKISDELNHIRQVIQFHGREKYIPYKLDLSEETKRLVDIIGRIDEIENGCIGATGYLLREAEEDAKGYRKSNPHLDMKSVTPEVWQFFTEGKKFDKMQYCKTYADYTLFAGILAVQGLKGNDRNIAKAAMNLKCNGYESALEGYKDIFSKLVEPQYSQEAFKILEGFYNDREYNYKNKLPTDVGGENR